MKAKIYQPAKSATQSAKNEFWLLEFNSQDKPIIDEKNGYVMSIVHDNKRNKSKLIIIDTDDFSNKPVAEILLPQRVPFGAHGSWLEN